MTIADVLAANQAFYDAHEQQDLGAMRSVWEHSDRVVCVHPGWPIRLVVHHGSPVMAPR
ncbi:hypothetical protein BH23ACT3_BH23ACT3_15240 [soil metagenome]